MEKKGSGSRFRFSLKEVLVIIAGTALALGSFSLDDPWVVIPMLLISGGAFLALCIWHHGTPFWRICVAIAVVVALTFIGWRDLHHSKLEIGAPYVPTTPTISQTATDSECSNLVAGSNAQIECETAERDRHAKDKSKP
jgi:hypothetical protein